MSIKNIKGDLLNSDCVIRCQIVNCCGVADGGLAAQVEEKYPEAAAIYRVRGLLEYPAGVRIRRKAVFWKCFLILSVHGNRQNSLSKKKSMIFV